MKTKLLILGIIIISSIYYVSCEKTAITETELTEDNLAIVADEAEAEEVFDAAMTEVEEVTIDMVGGFSAVSSFGLGNKDKQNSCRERFVSEDTDGRVTITITYLDDCTDKNGIQRTGSIVITIDKGEFGKAGFTRIIKFNDFSLKHAKINGYDTIVNTVEIVGANRQITSKKFTNNHSFDFTLTNDNGIVFTKKGKKTVQQVTGETTLFHFDDDYEITGNSTCTGKFLKDGVETSYSSTMKITTPLYKKHAYRYFIKGVKEIMINEVKITIDYGDGTEDSLVTITKDGISEERDLSDYEKFRKRKK